MLKLTDTIGRVLGQWVLDAGALRAEFCSAAPFPLVVIDGFLEPDAAREVLAEFPSPDAMPRSQDYIFGNKRELSSLEEAGPACRRLHEALTGETFAAALRGMTGWEVFVDDRFHGGGFHQGGDGSFLDMHADFNLHPLHPDWLRRLNILLYLNPDWRDDWGGALLVKADLEDEPRSISPLFNRAVIMETAERTFHGYRRMTLPPGVTRKSIAAYAYERIPRGSVAPRTTEWVPEDAGPVKRFVASRYNTLVQLKNRLFGSGTAANR